MIKLYIHIGTHKTGTTTIQNALKSASQSSLKKDWKYITTPGIGWEFQKTDTYNESLVRKFQRILKNKIQDHVPITKFILSHEGLCGWAFNGYQHSEVVYSMLRDATDHYNTKIIIYLRSQDEFIQSIYSQYIQEGNYKDFNNFLLGFKQAGALNYNRILNNLENCFGYKNIIVKSYHKASNRGLLADFSKTVGIEELKHSSQNRKNPSYSKHALQIAKICNQSLKDYQKRQLRKILQSTMPKRKGENFSLFTANERVRILKKYASSNFKVVNYYSNDTYEDFFPKNIKDRSISNRGSLNYEDVANLLIYIFQNYEKKPKKAGMLNAVRIILSGYPELKKFARNIFHKIR